MGAGLSGAEWDGDWITLAERARPDGSRKARYDALFAAYAALYPALKNSMHTLADLRGATS